MHCHCVSCPAYASLSEEVVRLRSAVRGMSAALRRLEADVRPLKADRDGCVCSGGDGGNCGCDEPKVVR